MEALVLIGHGSKLPHSKNVVTEVAEKIKTKGIYDIVEVGMMEFNEPTIPEAIKKVIDAGAKKVIVTPVFLAPGNHTERDIPKILGIYKGNDDCGHQHHHDHDHEHHHHHHDTTAVEIPEGVELVYRKPMGADDRIIDIVLDRANGL